MKKIFLTICIIVLFGLCVYYLSSLEESYLNNEDITNRQKATVKKIIDGDTINVVLSGEVVSVRLIGIDSPEKTGKRYGYAECYGKESTDYLSKLLPKGSNIELEYDYSQGLYDAYDRTLAYVFISGLNINEKIIKDGYGWEYTYDKPYRYQSEFIKAEKFASKGKFGLWVSCSGERIPIE